MITNFKNSNVLRQKANFYIPGGSHTYSKGDDQFPQLSPHSIVRGKGARIWDVDGNEFVDWGMGLTSVILGHAYDEVNEAVKAEMDNGINFIRPSYLEAEVAEIVSSQIPSAEMVKFAKNGSNATTAAIKLARAFTGNDIVLRCVDQPFFSIDDWFICDTQIDRGIPKNFHPLTKQFQYNNIESLRKQIDTYKPQGIACVILEPAAIEEPAGNFLQLVREECSRHGIVLIFDEVVSGFRFHPKGAQYLYGVTPDLSCFGKAIANGFSASALVGKRDIMSLGGISHDSERLFLLSTTYGGETHHLRAIQKTIEILNRDDYAVTRHIWSVGKRLKEEFNNLSRSLGIEKQAYMGGIDCRPYFVFLDPFGNPDNNLRTLFVQEMIKCGILVQGISPSFSHQEDEVVQTVSAFKFSLQTLSAAIAAGDVSTRFRGEPIKPVFRKFN